MLRSRFNGTEDTMEKIEKLAGKKNPICQSILNKVLLYVIPEEALLLSIMDQLGIYSNRIELLFVPCGRDIPTFVNIVCILYAKKMPQDRIIVMNTEVEFDNLIKECQ